MWLMIVIFFYVGDDDNEQLNFLREVLSESPAGPTPLCRHIQQVVQGKLVDKKIFR